MIWRQMWRQIWRQLWRPTPTPSPAHQPDARAISLPSALACHRESVRSAVSLQVRSCLVAGRCIQQVSGLSGRTMPLPGETNDSSDHIGGFRLRFGLLAPGVERPNHESATDRAFANLRRSESGRASRDSRHPSGHPAPEPPETPPGQARWPRGVGLGHRAGAVAPTCLAAWSIGRAPPSGKPEPNRPGARTGLQRPSSVLPPPQQSRQ
jgi:hypothetical protein